MPLVEFVSAMGDGSEGLPVLVDPESIVYVRAEEKRGRRSVSYLQLKRHYLYVFGTVKMVSKIIERAG